MVGSRAFWILAGGAAAVDLISKWWIFQWLGDEGRSYTVIEGFFTLRGVHNSGGVWGIGQDYRWAFAVVRLVALFVILYLYKTTRHRSAAFVVGLGLIFGGAVGNLWDTLFVTGGAGGGGGGVRDFLEFDLQFMVWPTFNLADSFITVGAVFLFVHFFFVGEQLPGGASASASTEGADGVGASSSDPK